MTAGWFLNYRYWFFGIAREMVLAVFTGQDGVVDVIVYSRAIDSKTGTLFCPNNALVRFMELGQNYWP